MRSVRASSASALVILAALAEASNREVHQHLQHLHKRHHERRANTINETSEGYAHELVKRGQCQFPTDAGLIAVTPSAQNAGWAMSPDQPCKPGNYCPYACPPGQVSMQWDPTATTYTYPQSMNGGLYCNADGSISKPFPDRPYCQSTAANIGVVNNAGSVVSFCQTVLPGNEAMLIPTEVTGSATLANPDTTYWAGTAAHYYINPPGTGATTACVWGTSANPWGNWSPYVAGANQDASGITYLKVGWNPIYLETTTPFRNVMPTWGVEIQCPNGGCSGLPCAISPSTNGVNTMTGGASIGAGGGSFCVVGVAKGSTANFVITGSGSSSSSSSSGSSPSANAAVGGAGANKGAEFYQSQSSTAPSSSTTTTSTTVSTTTTHTSPSTSATTTSTHTPSTTTTTSSSSTYTYSDVSTSTYSPKPSNQPYYNLFNSTMPASQSSTTAPTATGPSASFKPLPTTGAAVKNGASGLAVLALAFLL